jgi:hypothetical protein
MLCFPWKDQDRDVPYWVSRQTFLSLLDQDDFEFRDCLDVLPRYRSNWFFRHEAGKLFFILPVVQCVNGRTQFINGRHRTAVLLRYLERVPLALMTPFRMNEEGLKQITGHPLNLSEPLDLPNLPVDEVLDPDRWR